ncbi:hypothetical protein PYW07_012612 [Mythimna separata]|uniref:C2H2-type domain-containing protein n=1 Tax=Mythimna separata TaxID=271217 RepID=A0AAD8DKP9_MYTSE|nr:hypothetical protein PYW07_012612 [Mythimna separata]
MTVKSCKRCSYVTFRSKLSTYMSHVRIKHPSDIVCQLCGYSFVSKKGLGLQKKLKHRFYDHQVPSDGPWCTKCDVQFISKVALERHVQLLTKHSDETKSSKPQSRRYYRNQDSSIIDKDTKSKKKRNTKKPELLIACEQQLPNPLSYYRHFRRVHPDKNRTNYPSMKTKNTCEVYEKMFQSHTGLKPFKCEMCEKCFKHASEKRDLCASEKPWPQRTRSKKKDTLNEQQSSMPASDIQPEQIDILVENKSIFYNNNMKSHTTT